MRESGHDEPSGHDHICRFGLCEAPAMTDTPTGPDYLALTTAVGR